MSTIRRATPLVIVALTVLAAPCSGEPSRLSVHTPLSPPAWALLQRELLRANTAACREFFHRYFDERGYLMCVERWGGDDGPDDAIENCTYWPILHALGADDVVQKMYKKDWEGHLRQYTAAKTTHVPFAKDGMYYKEFPVMFDWLHNGEGLTVFTLQGLSDPTAPRVEQRARRYAGFYMNHDPGAPNYDSEHQIIRSMFNGSRGPLLRKATALDWAGDPIEIANRFSLRHGERTYQEMLDHFKDYNDIVGDHPSNLMSTSLAANAYMLTHEKGFRQWLLGYVQAWHKRMIANGNIIPTKIGLDGKIGGPEGKWYGGVYGWGFSVKVPQTGAIAHRNLHHLGFLGFMNAYLLSLDGAEGNDGLLDPWRKQIDAVNAQKKTMDGKVMYPTMYGDQGWYAYTPQKYTKNAKEIYYLSMKKEDRARVPDDGWLLYLEGKNPEYPEAALRRDLQRVRQRVLGMRQDTTTPDTRLADDPLPFNPASVTSLIEQMLGGLDPSNRPSLLFCRLRYFDPARRRAGLPSDVAALIDKLTADETAVTLVNVHQLEARTVTVQGGAYAEHNIISATFNGDSIPVKGSHFTVRLGPGCGGRLVLRMQRHHGLPTLAFPWDRDH